MCNPLISSQFRILNLYKNHVIKHIRSGVRLCSAGANSQVDFPRPSKWEPIYFFRPIKITSAVSNLKLLQLGFTSIGIPFCYVLENMAQMPSGVTMIFTAIGLSSTITLFIFSKVTSGLVGFLYTNQSLDRIKISYIDFWGKRKNYETAVNDVKPFSEIQTSKYNIYMPLQFYSNQFRFKLLHTFGEVYDFDKFDKVFGG